MIVELHTLLEFGVGLFIDLKKLIELLIIMIEKIVLKHVLKHGKLVPLMLKEDILILLKLISNNV